MIFWHAGLYPPSAVVRSFDFYHAAVFADNHSILGGYPEELRTGIFFEGIIPTLIADVLLRHHAVPQYPSVVDLSSNLSKTGIRPSSILGYSFSQG